MRVPGRTTPRPYQWYVLLVLATYTLAHSWCIYQIDLQLAKQGYRLAAWLNVIFDGATNLA